MNLFNLRQWNELSQVEKCDFWFACEQSWAADAENSVEQKIEWKTTIMRNNETLDEGFSL